MRISLSAGFLLAAVAVSGFAIRTSADPITALNPDGNQSTVSATAIDDDYPGTTTTNDVNSLPYSTEAFVLDGDNSSTVTPTLTSSGLNFAFSQFIDDPESPSQTNGDGDIFFTAGTNTTYSIAGSMTVNGILVGGNLITSLYDLTTSMYLYDYNQDLFNPAPVVEPNIPIISSSTTLTLDTSGGSLTGSLTAGDNYEFYAYQEMDTSIDPTQAPNLTGNVGLTLSQMAAGGGSSVPLPSAAASGLAALLGLGFVLSRRKVAAA